MPHVVVNDRIRSLKWDSLNLCLSYEHLRRNLRVFLTGHAVTIVTYNVACFSNFFDAVIVASTRRTTGKQSWYWSIKIEALKKCWNCSQPPYGLAKILQELQKGHLTGKLSKIWHVMFCFRYSASCPISVRTLSKFVLKMFVLNSMSFHFNVGWPHSKTSLFVFHH